MIANLVLLLSVVFPLTCTPQSGSTWIQEPAPQSTTDPIRLDLDAAIEKLKETRTKAREKLLIALESKEKKLLESSKEADRPAREWITAAVADFCKDGRLPDATNLDAPNVVQDVKAYKSALIKAEKICREAFDKACKAYSKSDQADLARAVNAEMKQVVQPADYWLGVWKPGVKVTGTRTARAENTIAGRIESTTKDQLILDVEEENPTGKYGVRYVFQVDEVVDGTVYMTIIEQSAGKGSIKQRTGSGRVRLKGNEIEGLCKGKSINGKGDPISFAGQISIKLQPK